MFTASRLMIRCHLYRTKAGLSRHLCKNYTVHADKHNSGSLTQFVYGLSSEEKQLLLLELQKNETFNEKEIIPPNARQLRHVAVFNGIPFIGFGLLDNMIMLTAGEYIDITFGSVLGITTMAAAALGNMISDVMGITTAGFIEQSVAKLGFKIPPITLEQMHLRKTRLVANMGRCIGVCIGCVLGMWPLFFISGEEDKEEEKEDQ